MNKDLSNSQGTKKPSGKVETMEEKKAARAKELIA